MIGGVARPTLVSLLGDGFMMVTVCAFAVTTWRVERSRKQMLPLSVTFAFAVVITASQVAVLVVNGGRVASDWVVAAVWLLAAAVAAWCWRRDRLRRRSAVPPRSPDFSGDPTRLPPWARPEARER